MFLLLIIAGRIINGTCLTWLVLCVCSRGLRLTGAWSRVLAPVACWVLGSGFGCSSCRKGEAYTFSWPSDRSCQMIGSAFMKIGAVAGTHSFVNSTLGHSLL